MFSLTQRMAIRYLVLATLCYAGICNAKNVTDNGIVDAEDINICISKLHHSKPLLHEKVLQHNIFAN